METDAEKSALAKLFKVGPYIVGRTLGSGCTGVVKLAFHRETGIQVALKIISKSMLIQRPSMLKKVEREIAVMKALDHPHVLSFLDVYESPDFLFIVLEYVEGGELFDFLVSRGALRANEALYFFQQIIEGLDYCHRYKICHRDLKPENLLLDANMNIKIADFGMATLMRNDFLLTSCGSPHYASPEVVMGHKYDGRKSDVWSCGVILYAMITGKLPFDDENIRRLLAKVKNGMYTIPKFLPRDIADLIERMLVSDPNERITIAEIKQHPFWLSRTYTPPKALYSLSNLLPKFRPITPETVDEEILLSLISLGWGEDGGEGELVQRLCSEQCPELVYYHLLLNQKQDLILRLSSREELLTDRPPSIPSIQDLALSSGTRPRSQSGACDAQIRKTPREAAVAESRSKEAGIISEGGSRRARLPRDKRQGSVKNLIALLGRKKSTEFKVNNDIRQEVPKPGLDSDWEEEGSDVEGSRKGRKKSKKMVRNSSKGSAMTLGSRLGKALLTGRDSSKEKDRESKDSVRWNNSSLQAGADSDTEGPVAPKGQHSPKMQHRRRTCTVGSYGRPSSSLGVVIPNDRGTGDARGKDAVKEEKGGKVLSRVSSKKKFRRRTKSGSPKVMDADMLDRVQMDVVVRKSSDISEETRFDNSFVDVGRTRSSSPKKYAGGGSGGSAGVSAGVSPTTGTPQPDVKRAFFSNFMRQQKKKQVQSVAHSIQLSTPKSTLDMKLQIFKILLSMDGLSFKYDSEKRRFTVFFSKSYGCRFVIVVGREATSSYNFSLSRHNSINRDRVDQVDQEQVEPFSLPVGAAGMGGTSSDSSSGLISPRSKKGVVFVTDPAKPGEQELPTQTIVRIDFKSGDLSAFHSVCSGIRVSLDL
eukprot:CAMPEP_0119126964 /NCGR_PEP_ID=MMETSP1310-20130426/5685_1 /TAXON_ID=464262 /ORGANISM="Genus nov. species nov., Strain RCC2339" /LENGTH=872 /DNA_ID=CAMNT_0007117169 /DNA_START=136 /DNA_END=2754 /DNA_ORIENTATION=+